MCSPWAYAQIGTPVPVTYEVLDAGHAWLGSIRDIAWGKEEQRWKVEFNFPKGWISTEVWKGKTPKIGCTVTAPNGSQKSCDLDFTRLSYAMESMNGEFVGEVQWWAPHIVIGSSNPIYYAEDAHVGPWHVQRVIWRVGGCSGNPPMLFLLIVQDNATGDWIFQLGEYQYPLAPDGGDSLRACLDQAGALEMSWWNYESRNTSVLETWQFKHTPNGVLQQALPNQFALYTRTGRVATLASTPSEARHLGYQEVAWALESWSRSGGVAIARGRSPRRLVNEDDRDGAPLLPTPGRQPFLWAAEIYVVPWQSIATRVSLPEALKRLRSGHWDVVLFPSNGRVIGHRLVEHRHDFPHSRTEDFEPSPDGERASGEHVE